MAWSSSSTPGQGGAAGPCRRDRRLHNSSRSSRPSSGSSTSGTRPPVLSLLLVSPVLGSSPRPGSFPREAGLPLWKREQSPGLSQEIWAEMSREEEKEDEEEESAVPSMYVSCKRGGSVPRALYSQSSRWREAGQGWRSGAAEPQGEGASADECG